MEVCNRTEFTCLTHGQYFTGTETWTAAEMETKTFKIVQKNVFLSFILNAFILALRKQYQAFPGNRKEEMEQRYVQSPLMSIFRFSSEDITLLWCFKGCQKENMRAKYATKRVCCVCVIVYLCVLSSAKLPQLCSHFA